jgi:hypothetical protein
MTFEHTAFVPNGNSRKDTAVLLVGTATEYGIHQHSIKAVGGGFRITQELADVLYDESTDDNTTEPSGNRAAKNVTHKE